MSKFWAYTIMVMIAIDLDSAAFLIIYRDAMPGLNHPAAILMILLNAGMSFLYGRDLVFKLYGEKKHDDQGR